MFRAIAGLPLSARTLPQTAHGVLREARVGVLQGLVVEAQLGEQLASVEAFQLQGEDDALDQLDKVVRSGIGLFLFWREARRPSSGLAAQGY